MALPGQLLAFWQFGSAGMLLFGLAAALPILLHLWSRRQHRQESWAAMSFLLAALRKNARRIQLEQWVLLAVRTAILLLFALALADPQLTSLSSGAGTISSGPVHLVLVIDASYSMDLRVNGQSRLDAAKELAQQLIEHGEDSDSYSLVMMGDPPRVLIAQPVLERTVVLKELDELQLQHAGANLPAALAEIETLLRQAAERSVAPGGPLRRRVCFITDMQQTTWADVTSADCRARLARLEKLASLEWIDVGEPKAENLAVTRVTLDSAGGGLAIAGTPVQITAEIQSFAQVDRPQQTVELLVDGQRIADERVNVPAGGQATVAVTHRFDVPGDHVIEVQLVEDALPLDNRRWRSVPVRETIRVLCLGGRPSETRHVALALSPQNRAGSLVQVTEAPESRLAEADLIGFDCLVLCNIGRFSRNEAALLHRYVNNGGGLVMFLGDQVQSENYNQLLVEEAETRILPAQLKELAATRVEGYQVDPLEYRHPIVAPFRGFTKSGLLTTPIWKYVKLQPVEGAQTALALGSGDPLIVEGSIGQGRTILVATAAAPDSLDRATDPPTPWTALPSWPSFPPLMHEMLRAALANRGAERNRVVGDELAGAVAASAEDQSLTVSGPNNIRERLVATSSDGKTRWSYGATTTSGVYTVVQQGNTLQRIAVNLNPRESSLSRFDPTSLPSPFRLWINLAADQTLQARSGFSTAPFRWLLGAILVLLIAEPLLAWQIGRGRA